MFFQLGTKVFNGVFTPSAWSISGNEANYAQHSIINGKPRLQLTGETLETPTLQFKLRANFCNPAQEIKDLETWKSAGEVLPLLLGSGEYVKDYVIQYVSQEITQTFADGTIIEADVTLSLLEYVPYSKEELQAAKSRQNNLAIGDKEQIVRRPPQKKTPEADAHASLMEAQIKAREAAEAAQAALESGEPESFISKVQKAVTGAQAKMGAAMQKVTNVQATVSGATGIIASAQQSINRLGELGGLMAPPISLNSLNDGILNIQAATRLLDTSALTFTKGVILRKF